MKFEHVRVDDSLNATRETVCLCVDVTRGLQKPLRELGEDSPGEPGLLDGFCPTSKPILSSNRP